MPSATQSAKSFARGTLDAMTRAKDRQATPLILHHGLDEGRLTLLIQRLQAFVPQGVSVVAPLVDPREAQIERLMAEKREMEKKIESLQQQVDGARHIGPVAVEWVSLTVAAKWLNKSYSTLWRAHNDGRLKTRVIGGKRREQLVCDPSSYRAKGRGKKA